MRGDISRPQPKPTVIQPVVKLWPSRRGALVIVATLVAIALILWGLVWFGRRHDQAIEPNRYQVVYLVTGQVYFGKLQNTTGTYLTLRDAYTVQNNSSSADKDSSAMSQNLIVKVTNQVYGPEDSMAIRADQVQFWQNLSPDSKVVKAIESAPGQ